MNYHSHLPVSMLNMQADDDQTIHDNRTLLWKPWKPNHISAEYFWPRSIRAWSMTANFSRFSPASNSGSIRGTQICSTNRKTHLTLASPCHQDPITALLKMSFLLYKAFPLSCLPLNLCQTQVVVHYSKL